MLHAVFDTNVLVSALIKRGKPRELWKLVLDGKVKLAISSCGCVRPALPDISVQCALSSSDNSAGAMTSQLSVWSRIARLVRVTPSVLTREAIKTYRAYPERVQ